MAPAPESSYLPPLELCLRGDTFVLSWKDIQELIRKTFTDENASVPDLLREPPVQALLQSVTKGFGTPTATSRSSFDTLTSAVNVTPSENGQYDITEIKGDALWLSKEAGLDELPALRIVLLDWQNRASARLAGYAVTSRTQTLPNGLGLSADSAQVPLEEDDASIKAFESQGLRRRRILQQYLVEKTSLLRVTVLLLGVTMFSSTDDDQDASSDKLREFGAPLLAAFCPRDDRDAAIKTIVGALRQIAKTLEQGCMWSGFDDPEQNFQSVFFEAQLLEVVQYLRLLLVMTSSTDQAPSSEAMLATYSFLEECDFFASLQPLQDTHQALVEVLQSLVSMVCMAMLHVNDLIDCVDPSMSRYSPSSPDKRARAYINDPHGVEKIHQMISARVGRGADLLTPASFLWVFVLDTIKQASDESRRGSDDVPFNVYQDASNRIFGGPGNDDVRLELAAATVDHCDVFNLLCRVGTVLNAAYNDPADYHLETQVRVLLLKFISTARNLVQYGSEIVGLLLLSLTGNKSVRSLSADRRQGRFDAVARYDMQHEQLARTFCLEAQARFPFEIAPFLQLLRTMVLVSSPTQDASLDPLALMERSRSFTQRLPAQFHQFDQLEAGSDDSSDFRLRLTYDLPLFTSRRLRGLALTASNGSVQSNDYRDEQINELDAVPANTIGVVADDDIRPLIVSWDFDFSPQQYLVQKLATCIPGGTQLDYASKEDMEVSEIADTISLLTAKITAVSTTESSDTEDCYKSLDEMLNGLPSQLVPSKDLPGLVSDLFEARLQLVRRGATTADSLELLTRCLQFFHAVALRAPNRLWPLLARSQLLGLGGEEGILDAVVAGIDYNSERLEFLLSCLDLFNALVDASVDDLAAKPTKRLALTRFGSAAANDNMPPASPAKLKSAVLSALMRPLVGVFIAAGTPRCLSESVRAELTSGLALSFDRILNYTYGVGDASLTQDKLTATLTDCAELLMEFLLSTSADSSAAGSILLMLSRAVTSNALYSNSNLLHALEDQANAAIKLSITAIRLATFLGRPISLLEQQLFSAASVLACIFATVENLKSAVARLLKELLRGSMRSDAQPPSLLGHMGPTVAKEFLIKVAHSRQPAVSAKTEIDAWDFLSTVVSSRQQWFAIYLLTGSTPKHRRKGGKVDERTKLQGKSIFTYALAQLSNLTTAEPKRTLSILRFVASCQDHWPWAMTEMRQQHNTAFIDGVSDYLMKLKRDSETTDEALYIQASTAGYIAEILGMYIHSARQLDDQSAVPRIAQKLAYLRNYGLANPRFNANHHSLLSRNFSSIYPSLPLTSLKHTPVAAPEYGENYFYDLDLSAKLLKQSTIRTNSSGNLLLELRKANENLSAVDSQVTLSRRWRSLALELAKSMHSLDAAVQAPLVDLLADVVRECLQLQIPENQSTMPSTNIMEELCQQRLELARAVLQELIRNRVAHTQLHDLFPLAWQVVRSHQEDFENAFSDGNASIYRVQLQLLFLSLTPLKAQAAKPRTHEDLRMSVLAIPKTAKAEEQTQLTNQANDLLEVLLQVVAKGFRSLANLVHEDPAACSPSDFVLITAILQCILSIPGIELTQARIAVEFASSNATRCATSLFSWATQLTVNNDPVYGELAILYLLELSALPAIAEQLAIEGVLSQLSTANLLQYYARPNGMGPFDKPSRLHSIWARGILPLCLNLMDAVGAPVAAEVAAFLNEFPNQIKRLTLALANRNGAVGARPHEVHFTLGMASELHTLALISLLLQRYREAGSSTGSLGQEIPLLDWDKATVAQDVEDWLQGRSLLGDSILPANEQDAELLKQKPLGVEAGVNNRLMERVVEEFKAALECLTAFNGLL